MNKSRHIFFLMPVQHMDLYSPCTAMSHVPSLQVLRKSVLYWQRHRSNSLVMAWLKYWAGGSTT